MSPPRRCDGRSEAAAAHLGRHRGRGTNGVGRVLVPGRRLADITRALPAKPVDLVVHGSHATINCGSSRFSLPTRPVEEGLPAVARDAPAGGHRRGRRAGLRGRAGREDTLPMLPGIRMERAREPGG